MPRIANLILDGLPQNVFAALEPYLGQMAMGFGDVIAEPHEPVSRVYFHSAVSYLSSSL